MKKKVILTVFSLFSLLLLTANNLPAEKLGTLTDLTHPLRIAVNGDSLYVRGDDAIYYYSLKDFTLVKKFGSLGKGPGKFKKIPYFNFHGGSLLLQESMSRKVAFFTGTGIFDKEIVLPGEFYGIHAVGENFIATEMEYDMSTHKTTKTFSIYDKKFAKIKELLKWTGQESLVLSPTAGEKVDWEVFKDFLGYEVYDHRIFLADTRKGFFISVYDSKGNKLYDIDKKYNKKKVTKAFKERYLRDVAESGQDQMINFIIRDDYPAFEKFAVRNGKIYVWPTYQIDKKKQELIILDLKGKIVKKTAVLIKKLHDFQNDNYYFLAGNENGDIELHAEKIE